MLVHPWVRNTTPCLWRHSSNGAAGGLLADTIGWRWAFLGQGPLCLVAFLTVAVTLHLPRPKSEHWSSRLRRVDFPGALVLVSAVTLLLVGLDQGSNEGWSSPLVITCLALSVPTFATFLFVEHRLAAEPFAPSRIVFERSLFAAYMANFFSFGGWFFVMYYLPLYFQAAQDVSATTAGLRLMPGVCAGVLGSILGGLTLQRTGRYYWLTVAGYGLLAVASAAIFLAMGADAHNNIGIYVSLAIGGFGNGSGVTTSLVAIIAGAAPKDQAVATACSYLFRSLGSGMGLSVLSAIAQQLLRQRLKAELHDSVNVDWIVQNVRESLDFVRTLDPETQAIVRRTYGCTITSAFGVMVAVALMSCISACKHLHPVHSANPTLITNGSLHSRKETEQVGVTVPSARSNETEPIQIYIIMTGAPLPLIDPKCDSSTSPTTASSIPLFVPSAPTIAPTPRCLHKPLPAPRARAPANAPPARPRCTAGS